MSGLQIGWLVLIFIVLVMWFVYVLQSLRRLRAQMRLDGRDHGITAADLRWFATDQAFAGERRRLGSMTVMLAVAVLGWVFVAAPRGAP